MKQIFIHGRLGSDATLGGDTTAAQKLARCQASTGGVVTQPLATAARLCKLLTDYYNENSGAKYLDLDNYEVVIGGTISGTVANPSLGYALMNCAAMGTPRAWRPWDVYDPLPPSSSPLELARFDGAVKSGTLGSWTYDAASQSWEGKTLPAAFAAANVARILLCAGTLFDKKGNPRCVLRPATETSIATYKTNLAAAIAAGTQASYNNTYVIENVGGTVLTIQMRVTELGGTLIDSTVNGARVYLDNNDPNGNIAIIPIVTADSTLGIADNAQLCLQNVNGANGGWMDFSNLSFENAGFRSNGRYNLSFENGQRIRVSGVSCEGAGHHQAPGITGGTLFADQDTQDIEISNFFGGRYYGNGSGQCNAISCGGNNLRRIVHRDSVFRYGAVLTPEGVPSSPSAAGGSGWWLGGSNVSTKPLTDCKVLRCRFTPDFYAGENTVNGGLGIKNCQNIPAGQEMNTDAYSLRFEDSVFDPTCSAAFYTYGTTDSTTGGPGSPTNRVNANVAFRGSVLSFTGGGGATNGTYGSYGLLNFQGSPNWLAGAGTCPAGFPRNFLFERCLIGINCGDPRGFANTTVLYFGTGKNAVCVRFKDCIFCDLSRMRRGSTLTWFDYINTGSSGAGYNNGLVAWNNMFLNVYANPAYPTRKLFANDTNLEARDEITGATRQTWQDFRGNFYGGFASANGFSAKTDRDSKAEWLAVGDPTGQAVDYVDLNNRDIVTRIRATLGYNMLGHANLDPMTLVRQLVSGQILTAPNFRMDTLRNRNQ